MADQNSSLYSRAFMLGVLGAFMMSILLAMMRWSALSEFSFSVFLGSALTLEFGPGTWALGFCWHLLNGGVFGLVYAYAFKRWRGADASRGTVLGFIHWLAFSLFMAQAHLFHPLIPSAIEPPGYFAINYGTMTAIGGLALHLVYGYALGNGLEGRMPLKRQRRSGRRYRRQRRYA